MCTKVSETSHLVRSSDLCTGQESSCRVHTVKVVEAEEIDG